ncbi:mycothiol conjugate amidase Mca [Parafrigoribacterium soli]|uniref:mycothiol conjugate amidase Mca n=1 Tax=Parafrigoribacterium soli TaxID=3144663 RepID=UPI0032EB3D3F
MTLRLLAVHAHPDDESSKGAGSYAYYRSIGVEVLVVSCTGGERGDVQNEALAERAMAERDMAGLRRIEMARAQAILGIDHRWLGYFDSGLPENGESVPANSFAVIPLEFSAAPLVKIVREFRPQVLVTYDENGGYPHPDHIRTHEVSMYAFDAAADAARYPELGEPWQISKVYYDRMFNPERLGSMYDELVASEPDSPLIPQLQEFRERFIERALPAATTNVNVGEFFEHRDGALRSHASQVPPDSAFFFWPNDLQRRAWPYEDFELVRSLVDSTLPESDLFAGIIDQDADGSPASTALEDRS